MEAVDRAELARLLNEQAYAPLIRQAIENRLGGEFQADDSGRKVL